MNDSHLTTALLTLVLLAPLPLRGQSPVAEKAADESVSNRVVTRQKLFSIPFAVNRNSDPASEVRLYVSGDRGKKWTLYQTRSASATKFDFHSGQDGEYWFAVGSSRHPGTPQPDTKPSKIVIVDTQRPRIDLRVEMPAAGKLTATWFARDAQLDARKFRLSYRLDSDPDWKAIDVILPTESEETFDGEASWMVAETEKPIVVKAEIQDQAGNANEIVRTMRLNSAGDSETGDEPNPDESDGSRARFVSDHQTSSKQGFHESDSSGEQKQWTSNNRFDADRVERRDSVNKDSGWRNTGDSARLLNPDSGVADDPAKNDDANLKTKKPADEDRDAGKPPAHYASSRVFNLDYDVESDGAAKVARVELWVTRDNGQTWEPFGVDEDLRTPFTVEVADEGAYGYQLLLHDQDGRANRAPQAGDAPDMIVEVDVTKPEAYLKSAYHGRGQRLGYVEVEWYADDRNLSDKAVILSYRETVHGPWIIIARDLPNTGHYEWQSPDKLPRSFYVQIDVQDEAGNRTVHQLADPTVLSTQPPRARLRAVQPAVGK